MNTNGCNVCCQMKSPANSGLEVSKVLSNDQFGGPAEPDGPVRDGLLVEARRDVEVVEAGHVLHEAENVVSDSEVTVVVFLKLFFISFGSGLDLTLKHKRQKLHTLLRKLVKATDVFLMETKLYI